MVERPLTEQERREQRLLKALKPQPWRPGFLFYTLVAVVVALAFVYADTHIEGGVTGPLNRLLGF